MIARASRTCLFLFVLLISASVFAICMPAKRELYVPAVVNENYSEMINIIVETRAGTGEAYISIGPTIGSYTQESEKTAAKVAYDIAGTKDCDVLLKIDTPENVNKVDGPSAGGAITLLILSALQQKQLRQDFSMTGTIEEDGTVGAVGGVPLKTEAVADLGKTLFIVPYLDSTEKVLVLIMQKKYNVTVVQVGNVTEAYEIAKNTSMPSSNVVLSNETISNFTNVSVNHPYAEYFHNLTGEMINDTKIIIDDVIRRQPNAEGNLLSRLENAKTARQTGNYYTAANSAFILSIDSGLLDYSEDNFAIHLSKVQDCIDRFELNDVGNSTLDNFELAGAANLRYLWAKKRMPSNTDLSKLETLSMKLTAYNDILFAENWCYAGGYMSTYSHEKGEINMTKAREIAEELISKASNDPIVNEDNDLKWHLDVAKEANESRMYVEAIIDANFVLSSENLSYLENMSVKEAGKELGKIINEKCSKSYTFLWPQLYGNHAKTFEGKDALTEARLCSLAGGLEESFSSVVNASLQTNNKTQIIPQPETNNNTKNNTNASEINISNMSLPSDNEIERPAIGETRKFSEPQPIQGWDLRYLFYIVIIIVIGYIAQHMRTKKQKEEIKPAPDNKPKP